MSNAYHFHCIILGLENAYAELVSLAVERRSRLEESRQLWQFYWDMAEEQNWIAEMGHVLAQADIGHDLTTIHLLLSKHNSLETEIRAHENSLRQSMAVGQALIDQGHFGSDKLQEEIFNLRMTSKNLNRQAKKAEQFLLIQYEIKLQFT